MLRNNINLGKRATASFIAHISFLHTQSPLSCRSRAGLCLHLNHSLSNMTSTTPNSPYAQARPTEPKRPPLSTANFIFTAEDDDIRENIRYRIYDFCFDIEYDKILRPTIMQYIRVLDLPPHPYFNREQWKKTMVHRHWSHKPRGLALLGVSMTIHREAFFRFYWFHFPNWILPKGDVMDLQRRLRKIPEPHRRNVNASIKFHRRSWSAAQRETENPDTYYVRLLTILDVIGSIRLHQTGAPWVEHTNVDGRLDRVLLGKGFHIIEQFGDRPQLASLCCPGGRSLMSLSFAGKLGNMIVRTWRGQSGPQYRMDLKASGCAVTSTGWRRHRAVKSISSIICGVNRHLSHQSDGDAATKQPTPEHSPQRTLSMAREDTFHTPEPTRHKAPAHMPEEEQSSTAQLRGGELLVALHKLNSNTLNLISSLEEDDTLGVCDSEQNGELLLQEEAGYSTHEFEPSTSGEVLQPPQAEIEPQELNNNGSIIENNKTERLESPATRATSREEDNADENNRQALTDPAKTHTQSPDQISSPLQPETRSVVTSESTGFGFTVEPMTAHRPREPSFEYRVAQWIERENDPVSSRKSSNSWSDGKEAGELSSRKRVSSSAFHTSSLPRRSSSNKQSSSSSSAVHSTAAPPCCTTSAEYPVLSATEPLAPRTSTTAAANASVEPTTALPSSSSQQQTESCEPLITTSSAFVPNKITTSPQPQALLLSGNTDAQITHAAQDLAAINTTITTTSPPQSRRVSASSNNASMCVGNDGNVDEPIVVPGARQFLTPKRDVKPWWESTAGEKGSQSTGKKKRRSDAGGKGRARERETRGSTSSWISLE